MIKRMSAEHVDGMVKTRIQAFGNSFLTRLGPDALKILYEEICSSSQFLGYVYINDDNEVIGFVFVGFVDISNFCKQIIRKRWPLLTMVTLKRILTDYKITIEILRRALPLLNGLFGRRTDAKINSIDGSKIAVDLPGVMLRPEYRGTGIAQELMGSLINDLKDKNVKEVYLSTGVDNIGANRFYEKLGFKLVDMYDEYGGIKQNRYKLCL